MTHIITNKNFPSLVSGEEDSPHYHATTAEASTMTELETLINQELANMENSPASAIALIDIQHSSVQVMPNTISYSAVLTFVTFGMPQP